MHRVSSLGVFGGTHPILGRIKPGLSVLWEEVGRVFPFVFPSGGGRVAPPMDDKDEMVRRRATLESPDPFSSSSELDIRRMPPQNKNLGFVWKLSANKALFIKSLFDAIWNFNCVDLTTLNLFLSMQILFENVWLEKAEILVSKCEGWMIPSYLGNSTWWSTQWLDSALPLRAVQAQDPGQGTKIPSHVARPKKEQCWFRSRPLRTWHSQRMLYHCLRAQD